MDLFLKKRTNNIWSKTINNEIQLRFLHRLSRSLQNGYPLLEALETLQWDKKLEPLAKKVSIQLINGQSVDQALESLHFHSSITSYLYFARRNGELQTTLTKCMEMFEKRIEYQKKFIQVIRYPIILIFIFSILLFLISQYVFPSYTSLFSNDTTHHLFLQIVINLVDHMGIVFLSLIIFIMVLVISWQLLRKKISIPLQIKLLHSVPIYRKYLKSQTSFLFATHLSTLLKTGMSINNILIILSQQNKLFFIAHYSKILATELPKGVNISELLHSFPLIEQQLADIFYKNSNSEALQKDLTTYASYLTEELHRRILKLISYIQPIFLSIIGIFIVVIYLSIMWPMFNLIDSI